MAVFPEAQVDKCSTTVSKAWFPINKPRAMVNFDRGLDRAPTVPVPEIMDITRITMRTAHPTGLD